MGATAQSSCSVDGAFTGTCMTNAECMQGTEAAGEKLAAYAGVAGCGANFCCVKHTLTSGATGASCDASTGGLASFGVCLTQAACMARSPLATIITTTTGLCRSCCVLPTAIPRTKDDPIVDTWRLPDPCIIGLSAGACMTESACLARENTFLYEYGCPNDAHKCCTIGEAVEDTTVTGGGDPRDRDPADCSKGGVAGVCVSQAECARVPARTAWARGTPGVDQGCKDLPADISFCCVENPAPPRPSPRPTMRPTAAPGVTPRIRVPTTPTRTCNLVTPTCSNMFNACGNPVIFDEEFMPYVAEYNRCAARYGTRIGICSTYRNIAHNRRVRGASGSNHLVGHAIDFNIRDRNGGNCNEACLLSVSAREARPGVKDTLACIEAIPGNVWGGNPRHHIMIRGHLDVVHCDDRINTRYPSAHVAKRTACNADRSFERVSCESYSRSTQSLLEDAAAEEGELTDEVSPGTTDNTDVGVIVGASIGAAVFILIAAAVLVYVFFVRKRKQFHVDG